MAGTLSSAISNQNQEPLPRAMDGIGGMWGNFPHELRHSACFRCITFTNVTAVQENNLWQGKRPWTIAALYCKELLRLIRTCRLLRGLLYRTQRYISLGLCKLVLYYLCSVIASMRVLEKSCSSFSFSWNMRVLPTILLWLRIGWLGDRIRYLLYFAAKRYYVNWCR